MLIRRPWTQQPHSGAPLRAHDYATSGSAVDRGLDQTRGVNLSQASGATVANTANGVALAAPSSLLKPWHGSIQGTGAISVAGLWCLAYCDSISTTNRVALQLAQNAFGQGYFEIFFGNTGSSNIWVRVIVAGPTTYNIDTGVTAVAGRVYSILANRVGASVQVYIDGVLSVDATISAANFRGSMDRVTVAGSIASASNALSGGVLAWAAATGSVIPPEYVDKSPWGIFEPRRIWVPQAAITGLPTLSLSTYKPGTLTSSGWTPRVTAS